MAMPLEQHDWQAEIHLVDRDRSSQRALGSLSNTELVAGIRRNDFDVIAEFYERFSVRLRYVAFKTGAAESMAPDLVHDTFVAAILQIRRGSGPRNPESLGPWLATIAKRATMHALYDAHRVQSTDPEDLVFWAGLNAPLRAMPFQLPKPETPEDLAIDAEKSRLISKAMSSLRPAEVEILTRFYLDGETAVQIMEAMNLTETQYRLNKSRAKGHLAAATRSLETGSLQRLQQKLAA